MYMKKLIIICVALFSFLGARAQRDCGLWLNEVPLVADTAANSLFVTIEPNVGSALKGTLRWDENRYQSIKLNDTTLKTERAATSIFQTGPPTLPIR